MMALGVKGPGRTFYFKAATSLDHKFNTSVQAVLVELPGPYGAS